MVLVTVSTTVCLYMGVDDMLDNMYPSDINVTCYDAETADQRQAVFERMEQYKERPEAGRLQQFKAEAEARRQLDHALKADPQERQKNKIRERGREQGE